MLIGIRTEPTVNGRQNRLLAIEKHIFITAHMKIIMKRKLRLKRKKFGIPFMD